MITALEVLENVLEFIVVTGPVWIILIPGFVILWRQLFPRRRNK